MFNKDSRRYKTTFQLDLNESDIILKQRSIKNPQAATWRVGMLFKFLLIMSLMIVKVSATSTFYQNQTAAAHSARNIKTFKGPTIIADNVTTTTTKIETTSIHQHSQNANKLPLTNRTKSSKLLQLRRPNRRPAKLATMKLRADTQQQTRTRERPEQLQQQTSTKQQHQHHHHQPKQHQQLQLQHAVANESAYLVERAGDDSSTHEQPIYGTWRMKARRPEPPSAASTGGPVATANTTSMTPPTPTTLAASAALTVGDGETDYQKFHVYERLPRRSSTMTPMRSEFHDQIPRPPRLTSRRPSLAVRRQYLETPINGSFREYDQKPKPFHFPYEGPLPEEFKKAEAERNEIHNIQDILQQLNINGPPTRPPQLVMMPTGLHIAGSFKNLKSSGIANFFRNKRNKKQIQFTFPIPVSMPLQMPAPMAMPVQFYGPYQAPMYGGMSQPYQRIAMDQIYPFKPRSPNEINLLAMQQQQLNVKRKKNKKNQATIIGPVANGLYNSNTNAIANNNNNINNILLQQSIQRPDHFIPAHYAQQWLPANVTQRPKLKRVPFKLNLDIFPVLPPTKDHNQLVTRSPMSLRNPFAEYPAYHYQMPLSNAALAYAPSQYNEQPLYQAIKFPTQIHQSSTSTQLPQSSNMQFRYPDQMSKYSQHQQQQQQQQHHHQNQHQQQQQQQQHFQHPSINPQQNSFMPIDCIEPENSASDENSPINPKSNQIMVHLNVFPKQKPSSTTPLPPTNPFYNINRDSITEPSQQPPLGPIDFHNLPKPLPTLNGTQHQAYPKPPQLQQRISRSDESYPALVDFDNPIVAADNGDLSHSSALVNNKLDISSDISPHYDHIETRNNNFRYNPDTNIDQLASEAQTASLFRFPVEDLIQFQVGDAL